MTSRPLQVLHLGFEDPDMPGAGGGSVRTHEINRRLAAAGMDITVLTARYPGSKRRTRAGVTYQPVGPGEGANRWSRLAAYTAMLPGTVRRRAHMFDLVVEDFFAPFSTMAAPLWTGRPTIGVVQWLHAEAKSREYGLPLYLVERFGVRRHHRLIAVSHGTAERLRAMNPALDVSVIGNGVDDAAFAIPAIVGRDVLFVGRLEMRGKGLDLLLEAWARAVSRTRADLVIAGTGPDEALVRKVALRLGIADRVHFVGWLSGTAKFAAMAAARLVVVPSREETFGLVAAEALATGTPVVGFNIPCLREVIRQGVGELVKPYDTAALADRLVSTYGDFPRVRRMGIAGRQAARRFDWDALAAEQASAYRSAVASSQAER